MSAESSMVRIMRVFVLKPFVEGEELFLNYMDDEYTKNHEYVLTLAF